MDEFFEIKIDFDNTPRTRKEKASVTRQSTKCEIVRNPGLAYEAGLSLSIKSRCLSHQKRDLGNQPSFSGDYYGVLGL